MTRKYADQAILEVKDVCFAVNKLVESNAVKSRADLTGFSLLDHTATNNDTIVICYVVHAPFGRGAGALSGIRPHNLAAVVIMTFADRVVVDPERIENVVLSDKNQADEDNRNVARTPELHAGLPASVTGVTVNQFLASSLKTVVQGSRAIDSCDADMILAGDVGAIIREPCVIRNYRSQGQHLTTRRRGSHQLIDAW